jgi:hypothetical protein
MHRRIFRVIRCLQYRYKLGLALTFDFMNIKCTELLPLMNSSSSSSSHPISGYITRSYHLFVRLPVFVFPLVQYCQTCVRIGKLFMGIDGRISERISTDGVDPGQLPSPAPCIHYILSPPASVQTRNGNGGGEPQPVDEDKVIIQMNIGVSVRRYAEECLGILVEESLCSFFP